MESNFVQFASDRGMIMHEILKMIVLTYSNIEMNKTEIIMRIILITIFLMMEFKKSAAELICNNLAKSILLLNWYV